MAEEDCCGCRQMGMESNHARTGKTRGRNIGEEDEEDEGASPFCAQESTRHDEGRSYQDGLYVAKQSPRSTRHHSRTENV